MSSLVLMENAGRGAADWIAWHRRNIEPVVVLCGTGNNGGDGLVIARHLHAFGIPVRVWIIGEKGRLIGDAASNLGILSRTTVPCRWLSLRAAEGSASDANLVLEMSQEVSSGGLIVDALLGTGASGAPRGTMALAIQLANDAPAQRVAIDIPSGLDGETGTPNAPTFRAEITLSFVASKIGFLNANALAYVGHVIVLPIGVPPEVMKSAAHRYPCEEFP